MKQKRQLRTVIRRSRRGQVWVETVIYTLIGLTIIGVVLGLSKPRIDAKKDELIVEQAIEAFSAIDEKITAITSSGAGNRRIVDLTIGKGTFIIDMDTNTLLWEIPSRFKYSEEDIIIPVGSLNVTTTAGGDPWLVTISKSYPFELQFESNTEGIKELFSAPIPYTLAIENLGYDTGTNELIVDISDIS